MNKHLKYLTYVSKHRWYVFVECCKLGIPFRGLVHDLSKYRPCEWFPYANWFWGEHPKSWDTHMKLFQPWPIGLSKTEIKWYQWHWTTAGKDWNSEENAKKAFDKAWLFHQRVNKHHHQWWVLVNDTGGRNAMEMPKVYAKEMVADWRGAGRAITGNDNTPTWYKDNRSKMILHKDTRKYVEELIGYKEETDGTNN